MLDILHHVSAKTFYISTILNLKFSKREATLPSNGNRPGHSFILNFLRDKQVPPLLWGLNQLICPPQKKPMSSSNPHCNLVSNYICSLNLYVNMPSGYYVEHHFIYQSLRLLRFPLPWIFCEEGTLTNQNPQATKQTICRKHIYKMKWRQYIQFIGLLKHKQCAQLGESFGWANSTAKRKLYRHLPLLQSTVLLIASVSSILRDPGEAHKYKLV